MNDTYLEIIDARTGDARKTGIGAAFQTTEEARRNFDAARQLHTPNGGFLLDLYINGNLVDTIELTAEGVKAVSGEAPKSPKHYVEFDMSFWKSVRQRS